MVKSINFKAYSGILAIQVWHLPREQGRYTEPINVLVESLEVMWRIHAPYMCSRPWVTKLKVISHN